MGQWGLTPARAISVGNFSQSSRDQQQQEGAAIAKFTTSRIIPFTEAVGVTGDSASANGQCGYPETERDI